MVNQTETVQFSDIAETFNAVVSRIVWCTVATVDRTGRPRTRILHPIWDGPTGWLLTNRHSLKTKHLARNPHVSLTYWDPKQEVVSVEAVAEWVDSDDTKRWLWDWFKSTPPPLGYDPGMLWKGPDDPALGVLRLTPSRIKLDIPGPSGLARTVWRAEGYAR